MQKHTIPKTQKSQYLNTLAPKIFELVASKAKARKAIVSGELLVNNQKVNYDHIVFGGDEITYNPKTRNQPKRKVFQQKLQVCYEDDYMAVLNKPGGIPVNGNQFKTLENALSYNLQPSKEKDALTIFRPLHRLDTPTCGLVVVAKTDRAQVILGKQFQNKTISKRYKAVVIGRFQNRTGTINSPVDGKKSETQYEVIKEVKATKYSSLTLVNLYPITGRTHQLRIHMSELGHPIIGDKLYTNNHDVLHGKGLMLCSDYLCFNHPITNKKTEVEIKIPPKFESYIDREFRRSKTKRD